MLELYVPKPEDLRFRETFMSDEETMSYNHAWGGTIPFPEHEWLAWYEHWILCSDGRRFYRYLKERGSGEFVGEIAYHFDEKRGIWPADVIIYAPFRGRGYGRKGLELLCKAAAENGIEVLHDDLAIDNPALRLFLESGFAEEYRTDEIILLRKELKGLIPQSEKEQNMENYRFQELVEKEQGFEFYQAFREEVDWIIGGKDGTYWFVVMKDQSVKETFIGTLKDGEWSDRRIKGKGKKKSVKEMPAGSTIKRIEERAYFMQDAEWVKDRKPRLVEDAHPHYHYICGMGDKALDVSEAYGVSIGYSDLADLSAGFHLRFLYTGEEVESPK